MPKAQNLYRQTVLNSSHFFFVGNLKIIQSQHTGIGRHLGHTNFVSPFFFPFFQVGHDPGEGKFPHIRIAVMVRGEQKIFFIQWARQEVISRAVRQLAESARLPGIKFDTPDIRVVVNAQLPIMIGVILVAGKKNGLAIHRPAGENIYERPLRQHLDDGGFQVINF